MACFAHFISCAALIMPLPLLQDRQPSFAEGNLLDLDSLAVLPQCPEDIAGAGRPDGNGVGLGSGSGWEWEWEQVWLLLRIVAVYFGRAQGHGPLTALCAALHCAVSRCGVQCLARHRHFLAACLLHHPRPALRRLKFVLPYARPLAPAWCSVDVRRAARADRRRAAHSGMATSVHCPPSGAPGMAL